MNWTTLKRLILMFWAVWLGLVVVFNVADALKALEVLPATFLWASGNYGAIEEVLAPFNMPHWLGGCLLAGVIVWEACARRSMQSPAGTIVPRAGVSSRGCSS